MALTRQQQKVIQQRLERTLNEEYHSRLQAIKKTYYEERDRLRVDEEATAALNEAYKKLRTYRDRVLKPILDAAQEKNQEIWAKHKRSYDNFIDFGKADSYEVRIPKELFVVDKPQRDKLDALFAQFEKDQRKIGEQYREGERKISDIMFGIIVGDGPVLDLVNKAIAELKEVFNV